jgi:hypothetical protein
VKLPDIAETDAPGAPISGFTMLSSKRGPREDVEASDPASDAMLAGSKRTEAGAGTQQVRIRLADHVARNVRVTATECAAERRIGSDQADDAEDAAAAAMLLILRLNEQVPRSTSTILPASSPGAYGFVPVSSRRQCACLRRRVEHRSFDHRGQRSGPGWNTGALVAGRR